MVRAVNVALMECRRPFTTMLMEELLERSLQGRTIVVVDRGSVHGPSHLSSAFMHAARAMVSGRSRARAPSMEVLRWLTGSHQLSEGIRKGSPGPDSRLVLVCTAPEGWPLDRDAQVFPDIKEVHGSIMGSFDLAPVEGYEGPHLWGGRSASKLLDGGFEGTDLELEMALLELVAFTDLV